MQIIEVNSTAALKIAYDSGTLFVQYIEDDWYKYWSVPQISFQKTLQCKFHRIFSEQGD